MRRDTIFGRAAFGSIVLLLLLALSACTTARAPSAEVVEVAIDIDNQADVPLRCTILFGHWVEQGLGTVPPGGRLQVLMQRQRADGALFVPRYDGRRMMVENLVCGPLTDWWVRRADITLLPVRAGASSRFTVACRLESRAACGDPTAM